MYTHASSPSSSTTLCSVSSTAHASRSQEKGKGGGEGTTERRTAFSRATRGWNTRRRMFRGQSMRMASLGTSISAAMVSAVASDASSEREPVTSAFEDVMAKRGSGAQRCSAVRSAQQADTNA